MATTSVSFFLEENSQSYPFFQLQLFSYHISFANNVQAGYGNPRKIYFKNLFEH